jgi:hypothetical protein
MRFAHLVLTLGLGMVAALAAPPVANADVVSDVLGCSGNPCVVSRNPGGEVGSFKAAAREIKRSGRKVVIDGPCYSACAILADMARSNVCVTKKGRFGFHKGYVVAAANDGKMYLLRRYTPEHSRDIAGWVKKNGGFPSKGFRMMSAGAAGKYWKKC